MAKCLLEPDLPAIQAPQVKLNRVQPCRERVRLPQASYHKRSACPRWRLLMRRCIADDVNRTQFFVCDSMDMKSAPTELTYFQEV
jgi:hypothetical protein